MRLKDKIANIRVEIDNTEHLINFCRSSDSDLWTCELIARMIDAMGLTDQQKLDLIDPRSEWEIEK
jgi:hypothetical protein